MMGVAGWGNAPCGTEQGLYMLDGIEVRQVDLRYSGEGYQTVIKHRQKDLLSDPLPLLPGMSGIFAPQACPGAVQLTFGSVHPMIHHQPLFFMMVLLAYHICN